MGNIEKKLTKGMLYVLFANILTMCINIITNFLLPGALSEDTYAAIKTFQLYMNFVGVFHLGYVDGVYLKYGGADITDISGKKLSTLLSTLRIFQFCTSILVVMVSLVVKDYVLLMFAFAIAPVNIAALTKMLYQAVGEFKRYSKITNLTTILTFVVNILLCVFVKTDNYISYLVSYVVVNTFIWIILEINVRKHFENFKKPKAFDLKEFKENVISGIALMCGNFASFMLTAMDRWFVKFTLETHFFAQYSFAVSMENMLNLAVTPVTVPLYNYLCTEKDKKKIRVAHGAVTLFAVVLVSVAFFAGIAVDLILPNYKEAKGIIYFLFAAQGFQIVIKGIYVNLYKAEKQQKRYFIKLFIVLVSGALFNFICFTFWHDMAAYALGTLLSAIFWYIISLFDFRELIFMCKRDVVFLMAEMVVFLGCGLTTPLIGLIIYIVITVILSFSLMNKFMKDIYKLISELLSKRKNKYQE